MTDGTSMNRHPRQPPRSSILHPPSSLLLLLLLLLALPLLTTGCAAIGVAAQALPEPDVPAKYADLKGHSVAAMVWLPRGLETDYPALRLDLTSGVMAELKHAAAAGRPEVKGATFPHIP